MDYYNEIKKELIENEIHKSVKDYSKNKYELEKYYNVGKLLSEAGKHYGEGIIKEYSNKLTKELGKGYSSSNLKRMRKFYIIIKKGVAVPHHLSWSHIISLLPINNINEISYYIEIAKKQNLSYRQLRERIKSHEYERLPVQTKENILNEDNNYIYDYIKNPIVIRNINNYEEISEKILQRMILEISHLF